MALTVEWLPLALDDLLQHDLSRARRQPPLRPITDALRRAMENYLARYRPGTLLPGQPVTHLPGLPPDIRMARITLGRTGGPYRVFFRYDAPSDSFEVWRVAYPRGVHLRP